MLRTRDSWQPYGRTAHYTLKDLERLLHQANMQSLAVFGAWPFRLRVQGCTTKAASFPMQLRYGSYIHEEIPTKIPKTQRCKQRNT